MGELEVGITHYDFHNQVKLGGHDSVVEIRYIRKVFSWRNEGLIAYITRRLPGIRSSIDMFGFTTVDASGDESVTEQQGVFRTNCLDWYGRVEGLSFLLTS